MTMFSKLLGRFRGLMPASSATKHVLVVSSGAMMAQVIAALAGPINSRLYTPADYGTLAIFGSAFSLFAILAFMRYDLAIPVAEDDTLGCTFSSCVFCSPWPGVWSLASWSSSLGRP